MKKICICSLVAVVLLIGVNFLIYGLSYFAIPFYSALNIIVAIGFAFYFTQSKTDERKQKELVESIVYSIMQILNNDCICKIKDKDDIDQIKIIQRKVFNKINNLKPLVKKFGIDKVDYIRNEFDEYWNFVSEHINDIEYLKKSSNVLLKHKNNIENALEEITVKLYFK